MSQSPTWTVLHIFSPALFLFMQMSRTPFQYKGKPHEYSFVKYRFFSCHLNGYSFEWFFFLFLKDQKSYLNANLHALCAYFWSVHCTVPCFWINVFVCNVCWGATPSFPVRDAPGCDVECLWMDVSMSYWRWGRVWCRFLMGTAWMCSGLGMRVICSRAWWSCTVCVPPASPSELVTRSLIPGPAPSLPRLTISYGKTNEYR